MFGVSSAQSYFWRTESTIGVIHLMLAFQRNRRLRVKGTVAGWFIQVPHGLRHEVKGWYFSMLAEQGAQ